MTTRTVSFLDADSFVDSGPISIPAETATEANVRDEAERRLHLIISPYREGERLSWDIQTAEAAAWVADNSAPTPFLTAALKAGETIAELVARVQANEAAFKAASGAIIGAQRTIIDMDPIPADYADDARWP